MLSWELWNSIPFGGYCFCPHIGPILRQMVPCWTALTHMSRGILLGLLGLRSILNQMPGETDCLPLFWGLWVDGFERRSLPTLCFPLYLQGVTHFLLCSFEAVVSVRLLCGWHLHCLFPHWEENWEGGWVTFGIVLCALTIGLPHWLYYSLLLTARLMFLK